MEPFPLPSELARRAERRVIRMIVVFFSVVSYLLLWKWGYLRWSPGSVTFVIIIPLLFSLFATANNPVELAVICLMMVSLLAVALPTFSHIQEMEKKIRELQKQRGLHPEERHPREAV